MEPAVAMCASAQPVQQDERFCAVKLSSARHERKGDDQLAVSSHSFVTPISEDGHFLATKVP